MIIQLAVSKPTHAALATVLCSLIRKAGLHMMMYTLKYTVHCSAEYNYSSVTCGWQIELMDFLLDSGYHR